MMVTAVTGQKDDLHSSQPSETHHIRRTPERGLHGVFLQLLESGHGIETAAADHTDTGVAQIHGLSHPCTAPYTPVLLAAP